MPSDAPRGPRWLSALELLLGAAIVIGHNVYRVVPNEVPILFVLGWISIHFRDGGWRHVGLARPRSWPRTVTIALAAAALRIALGSLVIEPLAARVWPPIKEPAGAEAIAGDWKQALLWLGLWIWVPANWWNIVLCGLFALAGVALLIEVRRPG